MGKNRAREGQKAGRRASPKATGLVGMRAPFLANPLPRQVEAEGGNDLQERAFACSRKPSLIPTL